VKYHDSGVVKDIEGYQYKKRKMTAKQNEEENY
jgi:hypothetical protein